MGRKHGGGVDHGIALQRRLFLQAGVDPGRRQSEGRLDGVDAGHADWLPPGSMTMNWVRPDPAGAGVHFLDLDDVGVGLQLDIVEDAHRRHHKAHLDRQRTAQRLDLLGQAVGAVGAVHQRQQRIAQLDLEVVDLQRRRDRLVRRRAGCGVGGCRCGRRLPLRPQPRRVCFCAPKSPASPRRRRAPGREASECPGSIASTSITPADMPSACG